MTTTYRRTNTDSDLTGGQDFNKAILEPTSDTTGSQVITLGNKEIRTSRAFTAAGVPGTSGVTGDYTVEQETLVGNTSVDLSVQLHRVNSAGTVQSSSAVSAPQTATAGVKTFTFASVSLGTWATGDRLRVDYIYENTAHGGQDFTVTHGGTDNEVVAPWTIAVLAEGTFAVSDSTTVTWAGAAASSASFAVSDTTTVAWTATRSSGTDLPVTTGLVLDLDATKLVLSDGEAVTSWPDSSAAGNDATGYGPTYKAGILNGEAVVRFDGVDDFAEVAHASSIDLTQTMTVVAVVVPRNTSASGFPGIVSKGAASNRQYWLWQTNGENLAAQVGSTNIAQGGVQALVQGEGGIATLRGDTTASPGGELFWNGSLLASNDTTAVSAETSPLYLAYIDSYDYLNGDIAQVVIYDRALTTTEREDVEAFLTSKWLEAALGASFAVSDTTTVAWAGTRSSSAVFAVADSTTVAWTGSAPTNSTFAVSDSNTVTWSGTRASSGTFAVADEIGVTWSGTRSAAANFLVTDTVGVAWSGERSAAASFAVADTTTVGFVGARSSSASYEITADASVAWVGSSPVAGSFAVADGVSVAWVGDAPVVPVAAGAFSVADTAVVTWVGTTASSGAYAVTDALTVSWVGSAPEVPLAAGTFAAADTATVAFVGQRAAQGSYVVADAVTVAYAGYRTASALYEIDDTTTIVWSGQAPGSGGVFPAADATTVAWDGATTSSGTFAVSDGVTVAWAGATSASGVFEVSDSATVVWVGLSPEVAMASGTFTAPDEVTASFTAYRMSSALYEVDDTVTVPWTSAGTSRLGVFEVLDAVTVVWIGNKPLIVGGGTLVFLDGAVVERRVEGASSPSRAHGSSVARQVDGRFAPSLVKGKW